MRRDSATARDRGSRLRRFHLFARWYAAVVQKALATCEPAAPTCGCWNNGKRAVTYLCNYALPTCHGVRETSPQRVSLSSLAKRGWRHLLVWRDQRPWNIAGTDEASDAARMRRQRCDLGLFPDSFEPEGREFESLRARHSSIWLSRRSDRTAKSSRLPAKTTMAVGWDHKAMRTGCS
jgi:hypothetical protein